MTKRTITIVCEVEQPEANWIWEQHMATGGSTHGISINAIANGDILQQRDDLEEKLNKIQEILDSGYLSTSKAEKIQNILDLTQNNN